MPLPKHRLWRHFPALCGGLVLSLCYPFVQAQPSTAITPPFQDKLEHLRHFSSAHVGPRNVTVWLPPRYFSSKGRFPVIYAHDGQNLFESGLAYDGEAWEVDDALTRLRQQNKVSAAIVVGIWNTEHRRSEYFPQQATQYLDAATRERLARSDTGLPVGDGYLKFVVEELKPYIDRHYRTRPGRESTFMMGSSMGGVISLYAATRYPKVFGAVACLSTHWPLNHFIQAGDSSGGDPLAEAYLRYLAEHLPMAGQGPRIYFDFGTTTLDALYEPYQLRVDALMHKKNYRQGKDWETRKFEGARHDEASWRERLDIPLTFLLAAPPKK